MKLSVPIYIAQGMTSKATDFHRRFADWASDALVSSLPEK